jgi:hypothetical protein
MDSCMGSRFTAGIHTPSSPGWMFSRSDPHAVDARTKWQPSSFRAHMFARKLMLVGLIVCCRSCLSKGEACCLVTTIR